MKTRPKTRNFLFQKSLNEFPCGSVFNSFALIPVFVALCAKVAMAQVILAICCALKIGILRTAAWHKAVNNGRLGNLRSHWRCQLWGWHFQWCEGFRWRLGELERCRSGVMSPMKPSTFFMIEIDLFCNEAFMKANHPEEARRYVTWHHHDTKHMCVGTVLHPLEIAHMY